MKPESPEQGIFELPLEIPAPKPPARGPGEHPIYFGIAGWSYPDWEGYVYPPHAKDKLAYVAPYVDALEINTTFYRPPEAPLAESWLRRTESLPQLFFTAKLSQEVTHLGRLEQSMIAAFHDGLAPLVQAHRLKHLLAQFRYDFADTPANRQHLQNIHESFGGMTNLTFEVRHVSWQKEAGLNFFRSMNSTVANLDYPTVRDSFNMQACDVGENAYFRLHGRNHKAWFDKAKDRDQTYNHLYDSKELGEIRNRAAKIAVMSKSLTMIANNHYQGKEMVNILQLKSMMNGQKVRVPPLLVRRYPALREVAE